MPPSSRRQAGVHRTPAFRWVQSCLSFAKAKEGGITPPSFAWYGRQDLNLHGNPLEPKSNVSANSTTPAYLLFRAIVLLGYPNIFLADGAAASAIDPGHSLRSLDPATGGAPFAPQRVCQFHHAYIKFILPRQKFVVNGFSAYLSPLLGLLPRKTSGFSGFILDIPP